MHNPHSYNEYKLTIETGDIFCTMSPAPFSRIIRWWTGSTISHCGVFLWIGSRLFIVEMLEWKDCRMMPASQRFAKEAFYHWQLAEHCTTLEHFTEDVLQDVWTVKYSVWLAVKSFFVVSKSSQSFCSASVAKWLKMKFSLQTRGIMPNDIANRCKQPLILITPH